MKLTIDFYDFEPWGGAIETWEKIIDAGKIDEFEAELEVLYENRMSVTGLNDLLWFDSEWCLELVGLSEEEDETILEN